MSEAAPAFSFYAKDFLIGTVTMSLAARGAYITLLAYQWDHGSVPVESAALGRVLGCTGAHGTKLWGEVGGKFTCGHDGLWRNARLELERIKQIERRSALRANGQKGGRPIGNLTGTNRLQKAKPNGNQNESLPSPSPSPSPSPDLKKRATHVEPPKKPADSRIAEFLKWFPEEYKARRHGADYLIKHGKHGALVKQMLGATDLDRLKKYAQILLNEKTDDEFIVSTDRGIEILSARFSWLSDRLAAWETRHQQTPSAEWNCVHEPHCLGRHACATLVSLRR